MLAADEAIKKKIYGLGTTALIISNEEIEDIMKILKSREESKLVIKVISVIRGTLASSILGNALAGKRVAGKKF